MIAAYALSKTLIPIYYIYLRGKLQLQEKILLYFKMTQINVSSHLLSFKELKQLKKIGDTPKDRYNIVYIIFYGLGCGTALPWNFFITANSYFNMKLKNEPLLAKTFQNYFSLAAMSPNFLMMFLNVVYLQRFSRINRICISLFIMIIFSIATTSLVLTNTYSWTLNFFIATIIMLIIINASAAVFQGALFGFASLLPSKYLQAVMAGQGLGGLLVSIISIISMFGKIITSAFGCFCTAAIALIISLAAYIVLEKLSFVKFYTRKVLSNCACEGECTENCSTITNGSSDNHKNSDMTKIVQPEAYGTLYIFRKILPASLSAFLVFFVTLSVYPSTTARVQSSSTLRDQWTEKFYVPVTCFLLFNLGDFLGKCLSGFVIWPKASRPLIITCVARLIFLPLFALCNAQPRDNGTPVIFFHDAWPIIFMIVFSISNGYLGCIAVLHGPRLVDIKDAEMAGTIMVFSVVAGLACGAAFSFAIAPNL